MKEIVILIIFFCSSAFAEVKLPSWVLEQKLSDQNFNYVICSNENTNPETAKKKAEIECLANIMKLSGTRTVASEKIELTLDSSSYEANISSEGVEGNIRCEFTDMFTQNLGNGYRVWLRCKIKKSDLVKYSKDNLYGEIAYGPKPLFDEIRKLKSENDKLKNSQVNISFEENGSVIKTSAEKLIGQFVFNGMGINQLMNKIGTKYLMFHAGDNLCKKNFNSDEVYILDQSRICVSGIDGIVIGVCNSNNVCFNK